MLSALVAVAALSFYLTGSALPTAPDDALLFQNALLLIVLGSALIEYQFTKPADSAVNALAGMLTLIGVYYAAPTLAWFGVFGYCALVFALATVCVAASSGPTVHGLQARLTALTYKPAVVLGSARLLFSIVFLFALFAFKSLQSPATIALVLFWGLYVVIWPLGIPQLFGAFLSRERGPSAVGHVLRMDAPNLVRAELTAPGTWTPDRQKVLHQPDGTQVLLLPLFTHQQDERVIGTGIVIKESPTKQKHLRAGAIAESTDGLLTADQLAEALGAAPGCTLIGFVVENSVISILRFATWDVAACKEGMLVFAMVNNERVYYQITEGTTREEILRVHKHGFQVAAAAQLGTASGDRGFVKFPWLPPMNAPVFALGPDQGAAIFQPHTGDFVYGYLPGSRVAVSGSLVDAMDHHVAILGITGSGKTELAFDFIRHAVTRGVKIICVDLTRRYGPRLTDLRPTTLTLSEELSARLGDLLFEAETGAYGGGREKKVLKDFTDELRNDIGASLATFLEGEGEEHRVGLLTLEEISNTKATLAVTEIYLSTILRHARERGEARKRLLIVLEEAHTVVPEPSGMGLGDYDSRGLVGKIAQIALQGRKYGVGLLVVAQRTATVSKSILTQCNTVVSFACIDDTSLSFLENVFGGAYTSLIPNLPALHAVVFGRGVRSERPLVVAVPYSEDKKRASDLVDGRAEPLSA